MDQGCPLLTAAFMHPQSRSSRPGTLYSRIQIDAKGCTQNQLENFFLCKWQYRWRLFIHEGTIPGFFSVGRTFAGKSTSLQVNPIEFNGPSF